MKPFICQLLLVGLMAPLPAFAQNGSVKRSLDYLEISKSRKPMREMIDVNPGDEENDFLVSIINAENGFNDPKAFRAGENSPESAVTFSRKGSTVTLNLRDVIPAAGNTDSVLIAHKETKNGLVWIIMSAKGSKTPDPVVDDKGSLAGVAHPYYWTTFSRNCCCKLDLKPLYFDLESAGSLCKEDCKSCEMDLLDGNATIIYNAARNTTTYVNRYGRRKSIHHGSAIKLWAGDPLIYIVTNVNPHLYDIVLTDTIRLENVTSTGLLDRDLFGQMGDGIELIGANGDEELTTEQKRERYLCIKVHVIKMKAEIKGLLDNLNMASPYLNICIGEQKKKAIKLIDEYLKCLSIDDCLSPNLPELLALYFNPEDETDQKLAVEVTDLYAQLQTGQQLVAYRIPRVPQADRIDFRLSITAKTGRPYSSLVTTKQIAQSASIRGFFKIDVSSGLYLGFRRDVGYTLRDDSVTVRDAAGNTIPSTQGGDSLLRGRRLLNESLGTQEFGFASYLHFYYKFSGWFHAGGIIGAGLSFTPEVKPRYFTGGSLMFGPDNRICLNGGLMWGNFKELSKAYNPNPTALLLKTSSEVQYQQRFRHTGFVSLSYNLPFINRGQAVRTEHAASNGE